MSKHVGTANNTRHHIYWSSFWPHCSNIRHSKACRSQLSQATQSLRGGKTFCPPSYYLTRTVSHSFSYTSHRSVHWCGWMGRRWTSVRGGGQGPCSCFPLQIFNLLLQLSADGEQLLKVLMDWNLWVKKERFTLTHNNKLPSQVMLPLCPMVTPRMQQLWISVYQYLGTVVSHLKGNIFDNCSFLTPHTVGRKPVQNTVCKPSCRDTKKHSGKCIPIPYHHHFQLSLTMPSQRTTSHACWDRTR